MASQDEIDQQTPPMRRRRIGCFAVLAVGVLLLAAVAIAWLNRERIAGNFIGNELAKRGIEATYDIESIGGQRQVLRNIIVGDPRRPDLTIEQAETIIRYRLGFPTVAEIRLIRPRLYGTYYNGKLSFGALDPLLFEGPKKAFQLPDLRVRVTDGRALLQSDHGPIGLKLQGAGNLRDDFAGELAATAPRLTLGDCGLTGATLYGKVSIAGERPAFQGPLRLSRLACPGQALDVANAVLQVDGRADKAISAFEGDAELRAGRATYGSNALAALAGTTQLSWRDGGLTARYDLTGTGLATAQAAVARLKIEGSLRARRNFDRLELDADVDGRGVRVGNGLDSALAGAARGTRDTLLGPLIERMRRSLAAESRSSRLIADLTLRRTGDTTALVVPNAALRGTSGATLLSISRLQMLMGEDGAPRLSGNFATGGEGLPRAAGRLEQRAGGGVTAQLSMAEYAAGESRLAIPELSVVRGVDGALGFSGQVRASGALPGGFARNLQMPVSGNWSSANGLAMWRECADVRFDSLRLSNLTIERRALKLCPPRGSAMVRYDARGLRIAAGAPSLDVAGTLGETPIALRSGPIGLAWPGALSARQLLVTLGPRDTATTFAIDDLTAQIGKDIAGRFAGTDVRLFAVPLDLLGASGNWRYAGGRLTLADGAFTLNDRQDPARFAPLVASGASLSLVDNLIRADALLREPTTGRSVAQVDLRHSLATGAGDADLTVPGLLFDEALQPGRNCYAPAAEVVQPGIVCALYGVVSNVRGTVSGTGRIAWNEAGVTSSGRFSTDSLDFAAAFGPVKGASGTVEFTDLLGMTTAPNQRLRVASVNPGIEVTDGEIVFQLRGGEVLALQGATWPFMGGTLTMRPVEFRFGAAEVRRYVLEIEGLDAARFVERMELENISARGIFDGTLPLVFDASGNGRIEGGLLISRPPGGNISYIGELTYRDLGTMANMAFSALRSLDYRQAQIAMDGDLTGEIVTRVRFDGVSQGVGAERNIATRALEGLPIRLDLNIRAQFYSLLGSLRALYDPSAVKDPRDLGLIDAQGNVIRRESQGPLPEPVTPGDIIPNEPAIQRRESEEVP